MRSGRDVARVSRSPDSPRAAGKGRRLSRDDGDAGGIFRSPRSLEREDQPHRITAASANRRDIRPVIRRAAGCRAVPARRTWDVAGPWIWRRLPGNPAESGPAESEADNGGVEGPEGGLSSRGRSRPEAA